MKSIWSRAFSLIGAIALTSFLAACGGGGSSSSSSTTAGGTTAPVLALTLSGSTTAVSSATSSTLTATLTSNGTPVSGVVVTFKLAATADANGNNFGALFPSGGTALTNSAGVATVALSSGGLTGADSVTASATVGGVAVSSAAFGFTATTTPVVVNQTPASIAFVSATPSTIAIKGTGGQENSTVTFVLRDTNGATIPGQLVNFTLNTAAGGVSLTSASATTDSVGVAAAVLRSGTTATSVRVTATLAAVPSINTISSQLVVSTAIPHQDGFSIAATKLNIEALNVDGVTTTITARLSDRYGNLVPDGTAVSFRTEGGVSSITPSCTTVAGACTVTLTSSGARPTDGRLSVLATAIGEESFIDLNGNGIYDVGEPFTDLPEAFIDGNENGVRNTNEEFVDFNVDGVYSPADGFFNGVLRACDLNATTANPIPSGCPSVNGHAPATTVNVRSALVIVMSGSAAAIGGLPGAIVLNGNCSSTETGFDVTIGDVNGNSLASGTTVAVSTTNGVITTPTSATLPDSNAHSPFHFPLSMKTDGTLNGATCTNASTSGNLTIVVTTPRGIVTTRVVPVTDAP